MAKTIVVCGHGIGISDAVANRFGAEGFQVALVARSAERLEKARGVLAGRGIKADTFPADLSDADATKALFRRVTEKMGPITAIHWNAYTNAAGDVMQADANALHAVFNVAVTSLAIAVQEVYADLKAAHGAVLVTNGGLGLFDPQIDAYAVQENSMGLAIANAAKHKLVGLLMKKLQNDGITVGEIVVLGLVKGTVWDKGNATIDPRDIAEKFWEMYSKRASQSITFS